MRRRLPPAFWLWLFIGAAGESPAASLPLDEKAREELPLRLSALSEQPPRRPSLAECHAHGYVRFLVVKPPEDGDSTAALVESARWADRFAGSLGLMSRLVQVDTPAMLLPALLEMRGDVVLAPMRAISLEGIRFVPLAERVRVVLVGRQADIAAPLSLKEAATKMIRLPDWPDSAWMLERLERFLGRKPQDAAVATGMDEEQVLAAVAKGRIGLAVVRSDQLEAFRKQWGGVEELFPLEEQVPVSWAVLAEATDLAAAIERFFEEQELTTHLQQQRLGDLDQIGKAGALRVSMLNNAVSYFVYRGQQVGFQYEIAERLARRLGLRLEVVVPHRPAETLPLLLDGRADVAVVSLPTDARSRERLLFSQPIHWSNHVLVQRADEEPVQRFEQLMWRTIYVRRSSQYWPTASMLAAVVPFFRLRPASEDLETEELIAMVGRGEVPLTISNSVLLAAEMAYGDDVQGTLVLARHKPLVLAVRADSPRLFERVERFVARDCRGAWFDGLVKKYLTHEKFRPSPTESVVLKGALSPYDELVRKYAEHYGLDWRLVVAQMYQESRFDPRAISWMGAEGLLQLMPVTSQDLRVSDPFDPEQNIRAGVAYLSGLTKRFESSLSRRQRIRFALAAYNAGLEHVRDARQLAWRLGLDPNRWFGNVEKAMLLLERPEYFSLMPRGYCRGSETVDYVSKIQSKYEAFVRLAPTHEKGR